MTSLGEEVRLSQFSHGAGCACKLAASELAAVVAPLRDHPVMVHPDLLVGFAGADDAGIYRLHDELALVQTVDFFTPVVDGPGDWGRIAAANALSDVYAMGGRPLTALQVLGWPRGQLPFEIAGEVLLGGAEVMAAAGCTIVGGHSIDSPEPLFGFAVTGSIHPQRIFTNAGGQDGDLLVLTKPLGMGIVTTAIKRGQCPAAVAAAAIGVMTTLNAAAGDALAAAGAHAATDVTGFGLLGHLRELALASGLSARIHPGWVPVLDGVRQLFESGYYPGGSQRNLEAARSYTSGDPDPAMLAILADAQTSGGLLVAVPAGGADLVPGGTVIGELAAGPAGMIELVESGTPGG
jgi:selenide,water dikinase